VNRSLVNIFRNRKKNRIDAYYNSYLYSGQSQYVRLFNYFVVRVLVLMGAFLFFLYFTAGQKPLSAFWAALSVLVIYHFAANYQKDKRLTRVKDEVNAKIAEEEFWQRINAMDKEGFVLFIQEMLSGLPGFTQIESTEYLESEGIDLIGKYNNELLAFQCHLLDGEDAVESQKARALSKAMSRRGYCKGIIISTTDFRDDTKHFCKMVKDKRQIVLLARKDLVQMAKDAGKYPREEEIKDLILKKIEHHNRIFLESHAKLFAKPRLLPYFLYGTLLLGSGMLFNMGLKYLYYLGASGLYFLGITGLIVNLQHQKRQSRPGWQDKLF